MGLVAAAPLRRQGCRAGNRHPSTGRVLGAEVRHHPRERGSARVITKAMQFGVGFPVRSTLSHSAWKRGKISKYQNGSVLAGMDAGADSASPVSLWAPPASLSPELTHSLPRTLLASQGEEEKIAVKMGSKSVSAAASALAERQTYL